MKVSQGDRGFDRRYYFPLFDFDRFCWISLKNSLICSLKEIGIWCLLCGPGCVLDAGALGLGRQTTLCLPIKRAAS